MKRDVKKLAKSNKFSADLLRVAGLCIALAFLLPVLLIRPDGGGTGTPSAADSLAFSRDSTDPESDGDASDPETTPSGNTLKVLIDGTVETMTLEEYLWGVVAAEMPAAFAQEALNAQTIAARTYTLYRMANPVEAHPEADICGDPGCCQAWISYEDRVAAWGKEGAKTYAAKITKAVEDTEGLIMTYEGEPILAVFHACSAAYTKSALEVWGADFPYLQSVKSGEDTDAVPNYYSTLEVSAEEFKKTLLKEVPKADLSAKDCKDWFGDVREDESGLPEAIQIGGVWVDTITLRTLFSLRSATITIEAQQDTITFYVTGYGHGVGMSQYGANALAKEGKTAEEILKWYYTGIEIEPINP